VRQRGALLLLPVLAAASATHAETAYVVEQLVVNVNSAPDSTGERIATIKSGDAVEVLDRQGDQVHVHLTNGTEGWVRKSYLSAEEPARMRLGERTAEVEKLKQDVTRLEGELAAAKTVKTIAPTVAEPRAAEQPAHEPPYFMTPPDSPARPVWHWALGSFVVALGLGFALGWQMLDRRIRRKYGGLRIY